MRFLMMLCLVLLTGCADRASPPAPPGDMAVFVAASLHRAVEDGAGRVLGSGTALGPALVATNRHVVDRHGDALAVRGPQGLAAVREVRVAEAADLALLRLDEAPAFAAMPALASGVDPHTPLVVAGLLDGALRVKVGWATGEAVAPPGCARPRLARLPVAPGFSGGPVVTSDGSLAGIVAAAVMDSEAAARRLLAAGVDRPGQLGLQTVLYLPASILPGMAEPAVQVLSRGAGKPARPPAFRC